MSKDRKKKKQKKFKMPKRRQPIFKLFGKVLGCFLKATVESEIESLPDKAIIASIHAAKNGPMAIALSYPKFSVMWGHHSMLGGYRERFKYLRNVLYIQKMHKSKFVATFKALYEALFSIYFYKGMKFIGTYTDMRFNTTIKNSITVLDEGATVIIYPEDSSEGYFDTVRSAFPGFVMLASAYYRKKGEDVPVIPAYISTKKRRLIIGKPRYVHKMELEGLTKQEIADIIKDDINALYSEYIVTDTPAQPSVKDAPVRSKEYYESVTESALPKADA